VKGSPSRLRRSVPIRGLIGANGSGKSLTALADLLPSLTAGRPVVSAVRILDWTAEPDDPCTNSLCDVLGHGVPGSGHVPSHPAWVPLRSLSMLLDVQGSDVWLDEVGALFSSRESASMPFQIATLLQQCRKRDITVTWTAPAWGRADKVLRECTQLATVCHGFGSRRVEGRLWSQRRLIHAVSYHAADLDDFEIAKTQAVQTSVRPKKQTSQWYRVLKSEAARAYDTFEEIPPLGFHNSGTCVDCGGRVPQPKCDCPPRLGVGHAHSHGPIAVPVVPAVAGRGAPEPPAPSLLRPRGIADRSPAVRRDTRAGNG
jgi:Zonular occludens toxin (Zot)